MSIRTSSRQFAIAGIMALLAIAAPQSLTAQASGTFSVSGNRVDIYNLVGMVQIRAGSGSDVVVDVDAKGADADRLTVETGTIRSSETLRVIYPDDEIVYPEMDRRSRSSMRVRRDGTFGNDGGGDRVTIRGSGNGLEAYADMTISIPQGKSVSVYLGVGEVDVSNVNGDLRVDVSSARVTSTGTRGALSIDTGSGSVDVTDAQGDVNIDTGSGSVNVSGISGSSLLVDTGSGSVTGENLTTEDLNIETGSGRITLNTVTASDVRLDTGSGSVRVDLMRDIDVLVIDTGSGSVTVSIPDDFGARLEIESSSGGIDFDMPVTVRRFSRSELTGTIGDGEGTVRVDTGSGRVQFLRR